VINSDGYRPNVGIILSNQQGKVLWARRIGQKAWQFPQGGMAENETPVQAMYREMGEEIGLQPTDVRIIGYTRDWLRYQLPHNLIRHHQNPLYIGQKQIWFLLRLLSGEDAVRLDASAKPEFDRWRWVDYWEPLQKVVAFKREVYEQALRELAPLLSQTVSDATISFIAPQPAKTS
jgi:putative (di)nucleoside polyphosphate hydrolase